MVQTIGTSARAMGQMNAAMPMQNFQKIAMEQQKQQMMMDTKQEFSFTF